MKLSDINPHIRYAFTHYFHNYVEQPFDSICYDCRLFYIKEGNGYVTANDERYSFSANTALFFPAGTQYHLYLDRNSRAFTSEVINFDLINEFNHIEKSLGTASTNHFFPERVISYPMPPEYSAPFATSTSSIAALLAQCCKEFLTQGPFYRETASALLKLCLIQLVRSSEQDRETKKILPVLKYIHENYSDVTLTNETIAGHFNYHPYYLGQLIRKHTGQPLHQYLVSYRIRMAKKKLITTDDSISSVAWKSGFQSPAYFIKQFKAHVGVTPSTYRKERVNLFL